MFSLILINHFSSYDILHYVIDRSALLFLAVQMTRRTFNSVMFYIRAVFRDVSETIELFQGIFKQAVKTCSNIHERDSSELQLCTGSEKTEAKHTSEFQLANRLCVRLPVLICCTTAYTNQTSFTARKTRLGKWVLNWWNHSVVNNRIMYYSNILRGRLGLHLNWCNLTKPVKNMSGSKVTQKAHL